MRFLSSPLTATIAVTIIAGCTNNSAAPGGSGPLPQIDRSSQLGSFSQVAERTNTRVKPATSKNLYVADQNGGHVTVYTSTGRYLYTISVDLKEPDAIAFDASQNLYVADLGYNAVYFYPPGQLNPSKGIAASCPNALVIGSGGNFYVADSCDNTVSIFNFADPSKD
ncbi:MAG TPA: hypothetical protein VGI19_15115, partial [Candidatus Cybelea sp.]